MGSTVGPAGHLLDFLMGKKMGQNDWLVTCAHCIPLSGTLANAKTQIPSPQAADLWKNGAMRFRGPSVYRCRSCSQAVGRSSRLASDETTGFGFGRVLDHPNFGTRNLLWILDVAMAGTPTWIFLWSF
jgi:hypothetical protein